jgi:hypothetical protein
MAPWHALAKGPHAQVLVERALYDGPVALSGARRFFMHVRIVNETASALGVDLREYDGAFYPNQWGASETPRRQVINEVRMTPQPLDATTRTKLLADLGAGLLTRIPARGSLEYYRDFNFNYAAPRAEVDLQARGYPYVIVAMDGKLDVSDGVEVERVLPADDEAREVLLEVPVRWGQVPAGAIVIKAR